MAFIVDIIQPGMACTHFIEYLIACQIERVIQIILLFVGDETDA